MKKVISSLILRIAIISSLIIATTLGVTAQWNNPYWGTSWNNPTSSLLQTMTMNKVFADSMRKPFEQRGKALDQRSIPKQNKLTPYQQKSVTFLPVANMIMPKQLAETIGATPKDRKELQKAFTEFLQVFDQEAALDKEENNVARAVTFFIVCNYIVATGLEFEEEQINFMERDINIYLAENEYFCAFDNHRKQELYESLVILGTLAAAGYHDGEENGRKEQMERFRSLARNGLETLLGVPVERLKLTKVGLVIK